MLWGGGMNMPLSVIIACYNGKKYLSNAIEGIQRQNIPLEIIVVDDSSTDNSAELAADLGCTVRTIPHSGQSAARNVGLGMAQGEFIMFHDQDDVLQPDSAPRMMEIMRTDSSISAVMAQAKDFLSPELDTREQSTLLPRAEPYFGFLGATLFRKNVFASVGNFSTTLKAGEAADLLLRIRAAGLVVQQTPFIAIRRRLHENNTGRQLRKTQFREYAASLRNHLVHM